MVIRVLGNRNDPKNAETLEKCKSYIISEMEALNDRSMDKEILMLDTHLTNLSKVQS
jgi:hypothetical protein